MDKAQQNLVYQSKNLKIEDFFFRVNSEDSFEVSTEGNHGRFNVCQYSVFPVIFVWINYQASIDSIILCCHINHLLK